MGDGTIIQSFETEVKLGTTISAKNFLLIFHRIYIYLQWILENIEIEPNILIIIKNLL